MGVLESCFIRVDCGGVRTVNVLGCNVCVILVNYVYFYCKHYRVIEGLWFL